VLTIDRNAQHRPIARHKVRQDTPRNQGWPWLLVLKPSSRRRDGRRDGFGQHFSPKYGMRNHA
jgi:hypothetical protein